MSSCCYKNYIPPYPIYYAACGKLVAHVNHLQTSQHPILKNKKNKKKSAPWPK